MCWSSRTKPQLKIAEKDIPIFKIMYSNLVSAYYLMKYQFDKVYQVILDSPFVVDSILTATRYDIYKGFHSYDAKDVIVYTNERFINIMSQRNLIDRLIKYGKYYDLTKVNGVIPKGSEYYRNDDGEYVSNQIILRNIEYL